MKITFLKPRYFFYLLLVYVYASYLWWTYLLLQKNDLLYDYQLKAVQLEYAQSLVESSDSDISQTNEAYMSLREKYQRQKQMIIGESLVFIVLLTLVSLQTIRSFDKEVTLANQQNNFLWSVTHELKTPLASIKLTLQTLSHRLTVDDKFRKLIHNALDDVGRLQSMVDNILYAARMDSSGFKLYTEPHNISDLLDHFLEKVRSMPDGHRVMKGSWYDHANALVDKDALYSAFSNLVENALKYSSPNKQVIVSLQRYDHKLYIDVADEGIGIPDKEKKNVFRKFYRIGNEETRSHRGSGLGLYIAKKIIQMHHGDITIIDNVPQGSIFRIILPQHTQHMPN